MAVEGFEPYKPEDAEKYNRLRWWQGMTWGDMFNKATDLYPAKIGLVDDTTRFTYKELREKTDRAAIGFMQLGIKQQDFVLLQLPNWHEFVISFFALQKIGAIVVLLISRHGIVGGQLSFQFDESNRMDSARTVQKYRLRLAHTGCHSRNKKLTPYHNGESYGQEPIRYAGEPH